MKLLTAMLLCLTAQLAGAQVTLISTGSVWKYLAIGPAPEPRWRTNDFDDSTWKSGAAPLGWGDGEENTVVFAGPDTSESPVTTYYRQSFVLTNRLSIYTLTLRILSDDGVIIYINGTEAMRKNMPAGAAGLETFALSNVETDEDRYVQYGVFSSVLVTGTNTVAAEIHQHQSGRHDCGFGFELIGNIGYRFPEVAVTRPAHGTTLMPGFAVFTAGATDADGHVAEVRYFVDGELIGSASEPPFEVEAFFANGRHSVRAIAYDNYGYFVESPRSFFQIGGELPVNLLRGPYLQSGSSTSLVVRWRTDWPTNSVVRFGVNPGSLNFTAINERRTSEHEVFVQGLLPDTRYHYAIASSSETFAQGETCTFHTAPTNTRPVHVWVIGDSGTKTEDAADVRDAYMRAYGPSNTDLWLMLGDNAYESGTDDEYQAAVFEMYPDILSRVMLWPTLGNHDATLPGSPGEFPYLDIFTLPRNGEAGGIPSGTEKYYSFDYANIHFICLDSQSSDRATNGPMLTWLREDLAETTKDWIVAFWHHPPYSKGTHNSDIEGQMVEMRERALPVLEGFGVDLVLAGHSHVYERSYLLDGHYGPTNSLQPAMVLDATLGHGDEEPYRKPASGLGVHQGAVYTVCGCSGEGGPNSFFYGRHPAMAKSLSGFGSLILRFDGLRLDVEFLRPNGDIDDSFTIDKSQPATLRPRLELVRSASGGLLSWPMSNPSYLLETTSMLAPAQTWRFVTNATVHSGRRNIVGLDIESTNHFYRLRAAP
jgi:hypothetical protein